MRIANLLETLEPAKLLNPSSSFVEITDVTDDSRKVRPGSLFVAVPGTKQDGARFAPQAAARGAVAILTECSEPLTALPQIVVPDARKGVALAARAFHGQPDRGLRIAGVTGTNGKSTTAYLVRHLVRSCGVACGMLGTVEYDVGSGSVPASLTTPDPMALFHYFRQMVDAGCRAAVMEVSAHSLHQHRVAGYRYSAAAFTNLTQYHLDYFHTMENYRDAKARLFADLDPQATAVINLDNEYSQHYLGVTRAQKLTYSLHPASQAVLRARLTRMDLQGTTFELESPWGRREVRWRLIGRHNVENALAALGLTMTLDQGETQTFSLDRTLTALERFNGVPGRLETVGDRRLPFTVLVDYAHTDDALLNVMNAMLALRPKRLIVVFGCGGDRDRGKRPKMAQAVEKLAHLGIVTSDNPRSEDPLAIIGEIKTGIADLGKFLIEPDRQTAIQLAVERAGEGDVVLIAGKGHEDYQIVGAETRHFDDRQEARLAIERRFGVASVAAGA